MESTLLPNSVKIFYMAQENELAQLLIAEMQKRNVGQREAAKIIGTSHPTLGKAIAGDPITFDFGLQLARFLHLPPEQVFRAAGLLPPAPEKTETHEKFLYLLDQLNETDQETIMNLMQVLLSKK